MIDTPAVALSDPVLIQRMITGPLQLEGGGITVAAHTDGKNQQKCPLRGVLAPEGDGQKGAARSNLRGQES